jgi:hypothetical protein
VVHDDEPVGLDGLQVKFDDERAVSDAGVVLVATLAGRLGIGSGGGPSDPGRDRERDVRALGARQ